MGNTRSQKMAIRELMLNLPKWWTLALIVLRLKIYNNIRASEAGVSARLRELRKDGWIVERELVPGAKRLYQYRLIASDTQNLASLSKPRATGRM